MDITVRLYRLHDYDLIYLYKNLRFPIKDAMKQALYNYIRGETVFFKIPIEKIDRDELYGINNSQFHIKLDEIEDADIIDYLSGLKKFYRNSFLKNLLRGYLAGPVAYVYEEQPDIESAQLKCEDIEGNILGVRTLPQLKKRKKKKDYIVLTQEQKDLFDQTGILDDMEVVLKQ